MVRFCYGVLAKILLWGIDKPKFQTKLHIMLLSVLEASYVEVKVDPAHASRWVNCRDDVASTLRETAFKTEQEHVSKHFKDILQTLVNPSRHDLMIFAIREVIIEDINIVDSTVIDRINNIKKSDLQANITIINNDVANFLAGAFLYAIIHVDNKEGRNFATQINEFMGKLPERYLISKKPATPLDDNNIDDGFIDTQIHDTGYVSSVSPPTNLSANTSKDTSKSISERKKIKKWTFSDFPTFRKFPIFAIFAGFVLMLSGVFIWLFISSRSPTNDIIMLASGGEHNLVLREDGTLWAWGGNSFGQLGNGTFIDSERPIYIMSNIEYIAAGMYFSVAIDNENNLWAWGHNFWGQLGNGDTSRRTHNIPVKTVENITSIATGYAHVLALNIDNELLVWGYNANGQLGLGEERRYIVYEPVPLTLMQNVEYISAGHEHSLAITLGGQLYAWGVNSAGQLGDGTQVTRFSPVPIVSSVQSVSGGGAHTLAIKTDGSLWAWGFNTHHQIGNNSILQQTEPFPIREEYRFSSVSAGIRHSLAICVEGNIFSWGDNQFGQVYPTYNSRFITEPIKPSLLDSARIIATSIGDGPSIIVDGHGNLWEWGVSQFSEELEISEESENLNYRPLYLDFESIPIPMQIFPPTREVIISAGLNHSLVRETDGTLWAWGNNHFGQLGDGTNVSRSNPIKILDSVVYVVTGTSHSMAIRDDGSLWAWGYNSFGQLGDGTTINRNIPVRVNISEPIRDVAVGDSHTIALDVNGNIWAWGSNETGALGDGTGYDSYIPIPIQTTNPINSITADYMHSIAIDSEGNLLAWGYWEWHYAGITGFYEPTVMCFLGMVESVSTSRDNTMFIRTDGSLWGVGYNIAEHLGDIAIDYGYGLVRIGGDTNWRSVSSGDRHVLAIEHLPNGPQRTWAWGFNGDGRLGVNSLNDYNTPQRVRLSILPYSDSDHVPNISSVSAGGTHSLAVDENGHIWAWGNNDSGQLGDKAEIILNTPINVPELHFERVSQIGIPYDASGIDYPIRFMTSIIGSDVRLGIDTNNTLWSWGHDVDVDGGLNNFYGQMGYGTRGRRRSAQPHNILESVAYVFPGMTHVLAIRTDGSLYAWGRNDWGQLGDGTTEWRTIPVRVNVPPDILFEYAGTGTNHSYAVDEFGGYWAWGNLASLRENIDFSRSTPIPISIP